jgi:uncharacterized protein (DUF924 family)
MAAVPADILGFWTSAGPSRWFAKSKAFDDAIRLKFEAVHHAAARGEYDRWADSPDGALALTILLDQFPRNLFRASAHAFATDPLARRLAGGAIERGFLAAIPPQLRPFIHLPFTHAEDMAHQDRSVSLAEAHDAETGDLKTLEYAVIHREVVRRFGRFPRRNRALGRITTPEEQAYVDEGGFAG